MAEIYTKNGQQVYDSNGATYSATSGQVVSGTPQPPSTALASSQTSTITAPPGTGASSTPAAPPVPSSPPTPTSSVSPEDQKILNSGVTPEQLQSLKSPTGPDPVSFASIMNNINTKLGVDNQLNTQKSYLLKHIYDSPLTPEQLTQLPEDLQKVVQSGNRDAIDLQIQILNDRIAGRANSVAQSINTLTAGYKDFEDKKKEAINNFIKFAQQFPNQGDAAKAMEAIYGKDVIAQLGINIPQLSALTTTAGLRYGGGGVGGMIVNIPVGTIAAQTNNPLNIKYSITSPAGGMDSGIAAKDGGTFASFDSPQEGLQAAMKLLQSPTYASKTIDEAMKLWSNNGYGANVSPQMNANQKISSLSDNQLQQLVSDMAKRESGATTSYALSDIQEIAKGIESGLQPPDLARLYGKSAMVRAQLQRDGFDLAKATLQWNAANKWVNALNSSQMARFKTLGVSVVNTIDEVTNLADRLKLGGVPLLNLAEMTAWVQTNSNHPHAQEVIQYLTAANTLKEEFANLAQGGYAPTEAAWDLANKQISENYGSEGLKASLTEVQKLINYRLNAPAQTTPTVPGGGDNPYSGGATTNSDPLGLF